jgi:aryl-phospho-beta-D-glucosidase BglC (GH1 family)
VCTSQGLRAKGQQLVNKNGQRVLLRGIGLGGWMLQEPYMLQLSGVASTQHDIRKKIHELVGEKNTEKFYNAWLSNHCTKADIDSLAAWGFNSVRLPMHYNLFTLPVQQEPVKGKNTWLKKGFELTDSLLAWCTANKIYLFLDLHAAPGGQGNDNAISDRDTLLPSLWQSEMNQQKTVALWERLARRYSNEQWIGGYDLVNEPNWGFKNVADKNGCAEEGNAPLLTLFKTITAAIRRVDKNHLVIIEGNCWGNNYNGMLPLFDDNMAISFHKYWNYTDQNSIQKFIDYREKYNIPVWMGESGENSNSWFTDAISLLEKNNIGWAWWPLKKMGINNPFQIKSNPGYKKIIEYWKGEGDKPTPREAMDALMQLAIDTKTANNITRRDVVDAMRRQTSSLQSIPFKRITLSTKTILFATDYDLGKLNHAYYDLDSGNYWVSTTHRTEWNKGWQYRNAGVDIQSCNDSLTTGYHIGWIEDGEWLQFSIFSTDDQLYSANIRYSSKDQPGQVQFFINDTPAAVAELPATGDFSNWQSSAFNNIRFYKGWNQLKIRMNKGGFHLNYVQLVLQNATANIN